MWNIRFLCDNKNEKCSDVQFTTGQPVFILFTNSKIIEYDLFEKSTKHWLNNSIYFSDQKNELWMIVIPCLFDTVIIAIACHWEP